MGDLLGVRTLEKQTRSVNFSTRDDIEGLDATDLLRQAQEVRFACECGRAVDVETRHLGPYAARGLMSPVRVLCDDCIRRLALSVSTAGPLPSVTKDGAEYLLLGGAFVHSDAPESRALYESQKQ